MLLKKPVAVSLSSTREWRNPLLLSYITSGDKKKKTKLLRKRSPILKGTKQSISSCSQSLSTTGNYPSSKTLPSLYKPSAEKLDRPIPSKTLENLTNKKLDKNTYNSEEQLRSWGADSSKSLLAAQVFFLFKKKVIATTHRKTYKKNYLAE